MPDIVIGLNDRAQILLAPRRDDKRGLLTCATLGQLLRGAPGSIVGGNR